MGKGLFALLEESTTLHPELPFCLRGDQECRIDDSICALTSSHPSSGHDGRNVRARRLPVLTPIGDCGRMTGRWLLNRGCRNVPVLDISNGQRENERTRTYALGWRGAMGTICLLAGLVIISGFGRDVNRGVLARSCRTGRPRNILGTYPR